jgi:hypothetical protein
MQQEQGLAFACFEIVGLVVSGHEGFAKVGWGRHFCFHTHAYVYCMDEKFLDKSQFARVNPVFVRDVRGLGYGMRA